MFKAGLSVIPACAETVALATILLLARETGSRIHVCRLSTAEGIEMVRQAKGQGLKVTCDVAVHHAHLSEMDIGYFDSNCHLTPPLRSLRDRDALRQALADGTADALCSDHAPVDDDGKEVPFGESETGATAVELLLPLTLKWIEECRLPLAQGLARVTCEPARVLGIDAGRLTPGHSADVCIFDPETYWKIDRASLKSQGKNTPFLGCEVKGRVRYTLVEGQVVYEAL